MSNKCPNIRNNHSCLCRESSWYLVVHLAALKLHLQIKKQFGFTYAWFTRGNWNG